MAPTDWEKAKKSGVDWENLTIEEWKDYLDSEHTAFVKAQMSKPNAEQNPFKYESQRKTMEEILGNGKQKPETFFDYIKLISHVHRKSGLMTETTKEGDRLRFFSHNSDLQPPISLLGPQAQTFKKAAKGIHDKGIAAPPWTLDKVQKLHTQFNQLSKDLTQSSEWSDYWTKYRIDEEANGNLKNLCQQDYLKSRMVALRKDYVQRHPNESGITDKKVLEDAGLSQEKILKEYDEQVMKRGGWSKELDTKISDLQQQMLAAYRFKLFSVCEFVPKQPNETPNQHKMRQFRIQDFLQQLNKNMRKIESGEITVEECFSNVQQQLSDKLGKDIDTALKNAKDSIRRGSDLDSVIKNLDSEIARANKAKETAFLGDLGQEKVKELIDYKQKLTNFKNLVDQEMGNISKAFLPTMDLYQSSVIKKQISRSAEDIIDSPEFAALPEIGPQALKNAIQGPSAIDKLYESGLKARVDHFYERFIPDEVDVLLEARDGINWIENLRARREVLEKLYEKVKNDKENFKEPGGVAKFFGVKASAEKNKVLNQLQKAYMDTLQQDMKELHKTNPKLAEEKMSHIQNEDIGKAPPANTFGKVMRNAFSGMIKLFGGKTEKSELKDRISKITKEVKAEPTISKVEPDIHPEMSHRKSVCENISKEFMNALNEKLEDNPEIKKVHVEPPSEKIELEKSFSDLVEMVADPNQHKELLNEILKIKDPHERMGVASQLFSHTFVQKQGDVMLTRFELNSRFQLLRNSLQDVYLDGIQKSWQEVANELIEKSPELDGQKYITSEEADQIFKDIILPELDSEILNSGNTQRVNSIHSAIRIQQEQLQAMSTPNVVELPKRQKLN